MLSSIIHVGMHVMNGFAPLIMSYMTLCSFEKLIHEWSVDHLIFFFNKNIKPRKLIQILGRGLHLDGFYRVFVIFF